VLQLKLSSTEKGISVAKAWWRSFLLMLPSILSSWSLYIACSNNRLWDIIIVWVSNWVILVFLLTSMQFEQRKESFKWWKELKNKRLFLLENSPINIYLNKKIRQFLFCILNLFLRKRARPDKSVGRVCQSDKVSKIGTLGSLDSWYWRRTCHENILTKAMNFAN